MIPQPLLAHELDQALSLYEVRELLSSDHISASYHAIQISLQRPVCLQVLLPTSDLTPTSIQLHQQQLVSLSALNHPYLTSVYDVGEESGYHYTATLLSTGKSLTHSLSRQKLSEIEIASIMADVCRGLQEAHTAGITHNAISSDCINLDSQLIPTLSGFAPAFSSLSLEERKQHDIASLGTLFYQLLTGQNLPEENQPVEPSSLTQCDQRWDSIVRNCLPGGVFTDISDIVLSLEHLSIETTATSRNSGREKKSLIIPTLIASGVIALAVFAFMEHTGEQAPSLPQPSTITAPLPSTKKNIPEENEPHITSASEVDPPLAAKVAPEEKFTAPPVIEEPVIITPTEPIAEKETPNLLQPETEVNEEKTTLAIKPTVSPTPQLHPTPDVIYIPDAIDVSTVKTLKKSIEIRGRIYYVSNKKYTLSEARRLAREKGATLASISDKNEAAALHTTIIQSDHPEDRCWLDGVKTADGWSWDSGIPWHATDWLNQKVAGDAAIDAALVIIPHSSDRSGGWIAGRPEMKHRALLEWSNDAFLHFSEPDGLPSELTTLRSMAVEKLHDIVAPRNSSLRFNTKQYLNRLSNYYKQQNSKTQRQYKKHIVTLSSLAGPTYIMPLKPESSERQTTYQSSYFHPTGETKISKIIPEKLIRIHNSSAEKQEAIISRTHDQIERLRTAYLKRVKLLKTQAEKETHVIFDRELQRANSTREQFEVFIQSLSHSSIQTP